MHEVVLNHKQTTKQGSLLQIRILKVPCSVVQPEGISYSLVCVRNGKRIVGYDNNEMHTPRHHKHIMDRIHPYEYIDMWQLIADFLDDVKKFEGEYL